MLFSLDYKMRLLCFYPIGDIKEGLNYILTPELQANATSPSQCRAEGYAGT